MSSAAGSPRRRPSARVYRRRRFVVLLGLLAVIVIVLLIVFRPGSGSGSPSGAPAQTGSAAASVAPTASSSTAAADSASLSPAAAPAPSAAATPAPAPAAADGSVACAAGNITVTPKTDSNDYSSGSQPQLSFTLTNTGSDPCTINAGTSKQVYTITSGSEVYWTSTDCQTGAADTLAMLAPGQTVSATPFGWGRVRSNKAACDAAPVSVPSGGASYHLKVSVDGITSKDSAQFILE
ncbi:hypothetical protein KPL76_01725 [Subtercola sp. PAMC28395]|uniref:hypothetical protein n=1 Tax=Subtercola sp. PAMC28395 TaxID=2846775 RepID=UPI001C0C6DFC|nr:hypothetical protein [Subtercola sp. PAMC28395]QWT24178.1 hypothetical protein KPL76_01725 [Subtercola sp. PAMC28395]